MWNPDENLFSIFGISLRYYSLMWGIGLILGYIVVSKLYKKQQIPDSVFEPLWIYCFIGIVSGARLGHCLFYQPDYYLSRPLEMILPVTISADGSFTFTGYAGLASHGGTLGLMIALCIYAYRNKINLWIVLDNIAIATPVVAFFIRIGNFMNSEIIGKPTNADWGVIFAQVDMIPRHPAQLYEAFAYLIIFILGLLIYRRKGTAIHKGFYFGFCLTTIFTFRFFVEFLKERQVDFESNMLLDMGQLLSIPFIVIGLFCMFYKKQSRF
jgi:prolipoprotein diacylglyceryl transferase